MTNSATRKTFSLRTRLVCLSVAAGLLMPAPASFGQTKDDDLQPKFIWGILIKIAIDAIFPAIAKYMVQKLTANFNPATYVNMLLKSKDVEFTPVPSIAAPPDFGMVENTVICKPDKPLLTPEGKENYQGLTVSLAMFDKQGTPAGFRAIGASFAGGERFKLRVLATFDAAVSIDAINPPSGARGGLYPTGGRIALLKRGEEVLLPVEPDLFFEFTG
ncbi:MAG: hypothetical protein MO853_12275 [Candidatus Protistobacter heckmanni]|nr:hypothetical protein [Candidatus Protistobacter heckmanni]